MILLKHLEVHYMKYFSVFSLSILSACSSDINDLETWIQKTNTLPGADIRVLPVVSVYEGFTYSAYDQRSPFDNSLQIKQRKSVGRSTLRPNIHRTPQILEKYPLDSLNMMGTIAKNKTISIIWYFSHVRNKRTGL